MQREIRETHNVKLSKRKCYRARLYAKRLLGGSLIEEYKKLGPYVAELKRVDPRGRFILEVDPCSIANRVLFKRLYVSFSVLRKGFLEGCRPIFSLDGAFLKGEVNGMILSVVAKDGDNRMYPIAWAVVEGENLDSWGWFISVLQEELVTGDGKGWTVVRD
ncbi:unnamed protein product [Linum trigynum]|uniref:MULE transposase domain-containing protein n=1 Tax=Linum trigynum TaxID=586398 RepID=A0AAV2EUM1_9ROSI